MLSRKAEFVTLSLQWRLTSLKAGLESRSRSRSFTSSPRPISPRPRYNKRWKNYRAACTTDFIYLLNFWSRDPVKAHLTLGANLMLDDSYSEADFRRWTNAAFHERHSFYFSGQLEPFFTLPSFFRPHWRPNNVLERKSSMNSRKRLLTHRSGMSLLYDHEGRILFRWNTPGTAILGSPAGREIGRWLI